MRFSERKRGFSLFEMLMALALAIILIGLVTPSWRSFLRAAESQALLEQLQEALQFSRHEALLRQETVGLCGSLRQGGCVGNWQEGALAFIDFNEEGGRTGSGQLLRAFQWGKFQGVLHWRAFPRNQGSCQFLPSGATSHENGTFWYCPSGAFDPAWALILAQSGQWRVRYPDRNAELRDEKGLPLLC